MKTNNEPSFVNDLFILSLEIREQIADNILCKYLLRSFSLKDL